MKLELGGYALRNNIGTPIYTVPNAFGTAYIQRNITSVHIDRGDTKLGLLSDIPLLFCFKEASVYFADKENDSQ